MTTEQSAGSPNIVVLFSGHMIDAPDRKTPRFPPDKEPVAATAIADALAKIGAAKGDLAICGGACGGDLLFAEAALARGMRVERRGEDSLHKGRRRLARALSRGEIAGDAPRHAGRARSAARRRKCLRA